MRKYTVKIEGVQTSQMVSNKDEADFKMDLEKQYPGKKVHVIRETVPPMTPKTVIKKIN